MLTGLALFQHPRRMCRSLPKSSAAAVRIEDICFCLTPSLNGDFVWICSSDGIRQSHGERGQPRVVKESSDPGVKLEQAAQSVATVNGLALGRYVYRREEEKIAFALVIPFKMMMIDVLSQCTA
jgi:hypothetical protein